MLVAVLLRYPVVFAYSCINIDFTIFFSKNKWKNRSHIWKHKNRYLIYVSSVCSCKIIRKYVYFYIRWRPSWISPFWTISRSFKKCNPVFFLIFMIFCVGIKWKINFNRQNARFQVLYETYEPTLIDIQTVDCLPLAELWWNNSNCQFKLRINIIALEGRKSYQLGIL